MKFNFEKVKDNVKKIATGAGVIATTFGNLNAQEPNIPEQINFNKAKEINITTENNEFKKEKDTLNAEYFRSEFLNYMEHPSYKERLAKEMYGDILIDIDAQKTIDDEYQKRLNQIKTVPIYMLPNIYEKTEDNSYYSLNNNEVNTTRYAAPHELTHAADHASKFSTREMGLVTVLNKFLANREMEYFRFITSPETKEYRQKMLLFSVIIKEYVLKNKDNIKFTISSDYLHENESPHDFMIGQLDELNLKDFTLKKYNEYISLEDRKIINEDNQIKELTINIEKYLDKLKKLQNNHFYYYKNTEIKARLNHLRIRAINEYQYDQGSEFQINKFNELKNDQQYQELKEKLGLSDEQINELMKYTAMNENNTEENSETYYHPAWDYGDKDNNQT